MSYSVLRRYTPPTCTLEILGRRSPLSRWASKEVLSALQFRLRLDDPILLQEQWLTLTGDRNQLEALVEVVSNYVQNLLAVPEGALVSDSSPDSTVSLLLGQASIRVQNDATGIVLQPSGYLSHQLSLGTLATEASDTTAQLSTLQLFDLASALDEYASDIDALPTLTKSSPSWLSQRPAWPQIAAVALVTIGLAASIAKVLDPTQPTSTVIAPSNSQGAASSDQRLALQLPPNITAEKTLPPATSTQPLPPPLPPGSLVPTAPGLPKVTVPPTIPITPGTTAVPIQPLPSSVDQGRSTIVVPPPPTVISQEPEMAVPTAPLPDARSQSMAAAPSSMPMTAAADMTGAARSAQARPSDQSPSGGQAAENRTTAFDTIPQVAEARRYFQQRWKVPSGLTQTLEYQLSVNANGTVQRIVPLGQAAGDFIDRTGMPLVGEPLVAPITSGQSIQLRLVLSPDGSVQTFLESL